MKNTHSIYKKFRLAFLFLLLPAALGARTTARFQADTIDQVGMDELAPILESVYDIKLYFKSEWFQGEKFNTTLADLSLEDCLLFLRRGTELTCLEMEPGIWIFVPADKQEYQSRNLPALPKNGRKEQPVPTEHKSIQLKEIVISEKSSDHNVRSTRMSAVRLDARSIKELPLFLGEKDILRNIRMLPGVQSSGEFGTGLFVRGGSSDQNLLLVEGVPLFNSSHVFGLLSGVNSDGIDNVTFYKSGIPAKYGERTSSVLDIRMTGNSERATCKGGVGLMDARLNLTVPLVKDRVHLLVGGRSSYSNWLMRQMPDVNLKNSSANFYDFNALLTARIHARSSLSVFGYHSFDRYNLSGAYGYHYANTLLSARFTHAFTDHLLGTLLVGYSNYRNEMNEKDTLAPADAYRVASSVLYRNARMDLSWQPTENQTVAFGLNAVSYGIRPGTLTPYDGLSTVLSRTVSPEQGLEVAFYVSDDVRFSPEMSAELGLRLTHYLDPGQQSTRYTGLEPRFSMRYSLGTTSSIKASFNRTSQHISLISNSMVMAPTDVYKLSSATLKPITCNQWSAGYFRNFDNDAWETSAEIYFKTLKHLPEYRDGTTLIMNEHLDQELLEASGRSYGIELYVKKNYGKLTGWGSYTWSRSLRQTNGVLPTDQINGNRLYRSDYDKPHNLALTANYKLTRRWWISGTFNYNTGNPVTLPELRYNYGGRDYIYYSDRNKYRLPDYHRLDVAITHDESLHLKRKWKGSWTLSILNLYGRKNPYTVFYQPQSGLTTMYDRKYDLYMMYIIARPIPTLTYNFTF